MLKKWFKRVPEAQLDETGKREELSEGEFQPGGVNSTHKSATRLPADEKPHLELPQFIVGVGQSVGVQRRHNEDALFTLTTNLISGEKTIRFGLYIIADGMGGHENGEVASSVAAGRLASHILKYLYEPAIASPSTNPEMSIQEILQSGYLYAHQMVKKEAAGGGTTLTVGLILDDLLTVGHIGDSRAYTIDPTGNLELLTHDHSLVKRLEEIGQITAEQASVHPQRNVLYRALGQGEPFEPDIVTYRLQPGYKFLVCTDGLWGVVLEKDLLAIIQSSNQPQYACQELIHAANIAGGPDNISVILVQVPE